MEFPRQEWWSGLPFPPPGDLLNLETEPASLASPELAGTFFTTVPPGKTHQFYVKFKKKNCTKELICEVKIDSQA